MTKIENPANFTIAIKMTKIGRDALHALAASAHMKTSEFCRKILNDRISYERALGNPIFNPDTGELVENKPNPSAPSATESEQQTALNTENKPNAARTAPPAESSTQGA